MAVNFSRYVEIIADDEHSWERRDRAMADNFEWAKSRLPKHAKIIVWCATVHAAKRLPAGSKQREPMGLYLHRAFGDTAAVIGFSALSGRVSRLGAPPKDIAPAASDSIESRALAGSSDTLRYLDRKQLHALGKAPAHPVDFGQVQATDWSTVLDGLLVLREERPLVRVRPAKPQQ